MAKLNKNYYKDEFQKKYSDGSIEEEMLDLIQKGDIDWYKDTRWPIVYHFSHLRQNILNWYPFTIEDDLLEVGSGCGALTSLFCEKCHSVTSVELTERRASINFNRNKQYNNLEIIVGNFSEIKYEKKFDYIIVNGVLEYAAFMFEDRPYESFLKKLKSLLKPTGKILLAIENRLGLKYFSGSKEDHNAIYFSGINNYRKDNSLIRTFSKSELVEMIQKAGLNISHFYYPYPDYKFPSEIFTDSTINTKMPTTLSFPLDMDRMKIFDEEEVQRAYMDLGIMDKFANSFLVEIVKEVTNTDKVGDYIKINNNRNIQFRIATILSYSKNYAYKIPLNSVSKSHIKNMYKNSCMSQNNLQAIMHDDILKYPILHYKTLEEQLEYDVYSGNQKNFWKKLKQFRDVLYNETDYTILELDSDGKKLLGSSSCSKALHWKNTGNIDLIASNIFCVGDAYKIIDYEWMVKCPIPMEYTLWRLLEQFSKKMQCLFIDDNSIIDFLAIDKSTIQCFRKWENHFISLYVGIKDLTVLSKNIFSIDMNMIENHVKKEQIIYSQLFLGVDNTFSEENVLASKIDNENGIWKADFCIMSPVKLLRWDPLEGKACKINILKVESNVSSLKVSPINSEKDKDGDLFYTYDPQYIIESSLDNIEYITIWFSLQIIDWYEGYDKRVEELRNVKDINSNEKKLLEEKIENLRIEYDKKEKYIEILKEENDKKEEYIGNLKEENDKKKECIEILKEENDKKEECITIQKKKINEYENMKIIKTYMYIKRFMERCLLWKK